MWVPEQVFAMKIALRGDAALAGLGRVTTRVGWSQFLFCMLVYVLNLVVGVMICLVAARLAIPQIGLALLRPVESVEFILCHLFFRPSRLFTDPFRAPRNGKEVAS
jgi:hypothetical protein